MSEITQNIQPINDISSKVFDQLFARFQDIDTDVLLVYLVDTIDSSALVHLADQFHIMGYEGWLNTKTDDEKRALIKKAIELHRYKGTKYALINVLKSLNINGDIKEWFEYGGDPYHFKIDIFLQNYAYNEKVFENLKKMIEEYKNVRSVLEEISIESQFDTTGDWLTYTNAENEIMIGL